MPDGTVTNPSYRPVTIFSPIDGHAITMYDTVSAAAQQAVKNVDTNDPNLTQRYDGFEINFNARLPKRGRIFGGSATDRSIANTCSAAATNPNLLNYCDQTQSGIPWRTQFKLVATYEIPWGVQVSGAFQSLPGYFNNAPFVPALQAGGAGNPNLTNVSGLGSIMTVVPTTRYVVCPGNSAAAGCTVGALIVPGMNSASFSVPLDRPEHGEHAANHATRPGGEQADHRGADQARAQDRRVQRAELERLLQRPDHDVQPDVGARRFGARDQAARRRRTWRRPASCKAGCSASAST